MQTRSVQTIEITEAILINLNLKTVLKIAITIRFPESSELLSRSSSISEN